VGYSHSATTHPLSRKGVRGGSSQISSPREPKARRKEFETTPTKKIGKRVYKFKRTRNSRNSLRGGVVVGGVWGDLLA